MSEFILIEDTVINVDHVIVVYPEFDLKKPNSEPIDLIIRLADGCLVVMSKAVYNDLVKNQGDKKPEPIASFLVLCGKLWLLRSKK